MKKLFTALLVLAMSSFVLPSTHADTFVDEQVAKPMTPPEKVAGWIGAYVDDTTRQHFGSMMLSGTVQVINAGQSPRIKSWADVLSGGGPNMTYNLILPPCSGSITNDCFTNLQATNSEGKVVDGVLYGLFPDMATPSFVGDQSVGLPSGWSPSIWSFPGITHTGGDKFLVVPTAFDYGVPVSQGTKHMQLQVAIYAVSLVDQQTPPSSGIGFTNVYNERCPLWYGSGKCAVQYALPKNVGFNLSVKLSGKVQGWVHGRLQSPNISILPNGANGEIINISGSPVTVPIFQSWKKFAELPADFQTYLQLQNEPRAGSYWAPNGSQDWHSFWDGLGVAPYTKLSTLHDLSNYDALDFNEFTRWLSVSDNKAVASKSMWAFYTANSGRSGAIDNSPCGTLAGGVSGVVTSNATMFISAPPTFNATTTSLDYQVSSPHFDRNGNANIGSYNLLLNSAVARCLYNFTNAPVKASVSIISADGSSQAATSVLNETDGWLKLAVSGFSYSAPTISVKLTQDAAPVVTPVAPVVTTPVPSTVAMAKKITITCVKGKITKKVTAIKPNCPSGYKKK